MPIVKPQILDIQPFPKQALIFVSAVQVFRKHSRKSKIACNKQFLLFPLCFPPICRTLGSFSSNLKLSSANTLSLEESKICRFGKGKLYTPDHNVLDSTKLTAFARLNEFKWYNCVYGRKHYGNRRKCCFFSCSLTILSKSLSFRAVKTRNCVWKSKNFCLCVCGGVSDSVDLIRLQPCLCSTLYQTTIFKLVQIERNCRQIKHHWNIFFLKRIETIVEKAENAGLQHFLLFPQCFQKASFSGPLKVGIV